MLTGIGGFGKLYVDRLFELEDAGKAEVVGIVEPYPEYCEHFEKIKMRNWKLYSDMDSIYAENNCALACIVTPTQFHTKMIITALNHGSNVLCEKPLTGDINDVERLLEVREKSGKFVMIGYQWSYSEAILSLKKDILSGVYGKPEFLKSIVLWPRDKSYFKRGTGWAGKIKADDGTLILDSVANNAAAHYLHNMFFVLGKDMHSSAEPEDVTAELFRVNEIQNFDTAIIELKINRARALYIASHAIDKILNPIFEYRFENGVIYFSEENGNEIIGKLADGTIIRYGNPFRNQMQKLDYAISNVEQEIPFVPCGIEAACAQTKCITECAKFEIKSFPNEKIRIGEAELVCADGLYEELVKLYNDAN